MAKKTTKSKRREVDDDEEEGTDEGIEAQLAALDDEGWEDTEETEDNFGEIPKGKYQVKIDEATVAPAKSSGRLQINVAMTIASGKYKGRKLWNHSMALDTAEARGKTRGTLAKLGLEWPESAKELPGYLADEFVGSFAEVNVSPQKDGNGVNTYFNRAIDSEDVEEDEEEEVERPSKKSKTAKPKKPAVEEDDEDEEEDEEEEAPAAKKSTKKAAAEEEDPDDAVITKFKDRDLDKSQLKAIKRLGVKHDLPPDDYDKMTDLMADLAEFLGISGTFDDPALLMKKITKADAARGDDEDEDDDED